MNEANEGIRDAARAIAAHAERRRLPLKRLCRDFPALGSDKTFRDMRDGATEGYDLARLGPAYAAVAALLEEAGADGERVYDDLRPVRELRAAVAEAMRSWGINRVVIMQAESGDGKSTAARILAAKLGDRVATVEAADAWGDKPGAFLGAVLRALGDSVMPQSAAERLEKAQTALCASRRCLIIDEAHHCGPRILNTVKTLVNTTPGEFVLLAIPTLWTKLERTSYLEARQVSTNRLSERVQVGLDDAACIEYLRLALPEADAAEVKRACKTLRTAANRHGNYAFLRDVVREAGGAAPTAQALAEAAAQVAARR